MPGPSRPAGSAHRGPPDGDQALPTNGSPGREGGPFECSPRTLPGNHRRWVLGSTLATFPTAPPIEELNGLVQPRRCGRERSSHARYGHRSSPGFRLRADGAGRGRSEGDHRISPVSSWRGVPSSSTRRVRSQSSAPAPGRGGYGGGGGDSTGVATSGGGGRRRRESPARAPLVAAVPGSRDAGRIAPARLASLDGPARVCPPPVLDLVRSVYSSTTHPSRRRMMRSPYEAFVSECVTCTIVVPVRVQLLEQLHDLAALLRVQVAGRLVRQNHLRVRDDRAGHRHQLLLSARQLIRIEVLLADDLRSGRGCRTRSLSRSDFLMLR